MGRSRRTRKAPATFEEQLAMLNRNDAIRRGDLPPAGLSEAAGAALAPPVDLAAAVQSTAARKTGIYAQLIAGYRPDEVALQYHTTEDEVLEVQEEMADRTLRMVSGSVKHLAAVDLDRLDALLRVLWLNALTGDVYSIDRCVKILERRAKMLGLDTANVLKPEESKSDLSHMTVEELKELKRLQEKAGKR